MLIPLQEFLYINMSHERIADQERIVIKRAILKSHDNREGGFPVFLLIDKTSGIIPVIYPHAYA